MTTGGGITSRDPLTISRAATDATVKTLRGDGGQEEERKKEDLRKALRRTFLA